MSKSKPSILACLSHISICLIPTSWSRCLYVYFQRSSYIFPTWRARRRIRCRLTPRTTFSPWTTPSSRRRGHLWPDIFAQNLTKDCSQLFMILAVFSTFHVRTYFTLISHVIFSRFVAFLDFQTFHIFSRFSRLNSTPPMSSSRSSRSAHPHPVWSFDFCGFAARVFIGQVGPIPTTVYQSFINHFRGRLIFS